MVARSGRTWLSALLGWLLVACTASPMPPAATPDWLWMPVWGSTKVVAFDPDQQATGGDAVTPALAIGLGPGRFPYALTFDGDGNAWVGTQAGEILRIDAEDLATSGTPLPSVVLDSGSSDVRALAFGADGTLWATVATDVRGWSADRLLASGAPAPSIVVAGTVAAPLLYPTDLAFDDDGGLWVVASASTAVEKYRPEDLVSGPATPVVRLVGPGPTPLRVAFDADGRLWSSSVFGPGFVGSGFVGSVLPADQVASGAMAIDVGFFDLGSLDAGGTIVFAPGPD